MTSKRAAIEVESGSLQAELIEIKERLGSLETITSLANRKEVEEQARGLLTTLQRRALMSACDTSKTKDQLKTELGLKDVQTLDYHLSPLRDGDLIHQKTNSQGVLTFEWSRLFRSLPKTRKALLLEEFDAKPKKGPGRKAGEQES